jgi:hypothetical protein
MPQLPIEFLIRNVIVLPYDMIRITIAIAIGTALVIGTLMYGAANQAFAATPCSLTVGNSGAGTISGKLECGGQGLGHATIHITLHGITTGSTNTATAQTETPDGSYDRTVRLVPGHSYTVDAKYDGDSNHESTSATASFSQATNNAGNTQQSNNAGNTQQSNNAGNTQQSNNAGNTQQNAATPCTLTVGTPSGEELPNSITGKLSCGGQGISHATIKISGLPGGSTESTTTSDDGSYEQGVFSPFSAGQSYHVTAKYDGDSSHQAASATTSVNIKGSTGSTQESNNAGGSTQKSGSSGSGSGQESGSSGSGSGQESGSSGSGSGQSGSSSSGSGSGQESGSSGSGSGQESGSSGSGSGQQANP